MSEPFRGVYAIAQTPFTENGDLIWEDFERECDWIVRAGAHGFVWPVMASEYTVVSFPERVQGMKIAVQTVAGRIPVVIGVADTSKAGAVALAEEAGAAGADAVIAMPPWATKVASRGLIEEYYRDIAEAAGIPVIIQNADPPLGSALPGVFVVELCRKIPLVEYVKEEKRPQGHSVSEILAMADPAVKGIFAGSQCLWLLADHKRGCCGNMPGSHVADVDAQIWDLLEEGREEEARRIHNAKLVLENALQGLRPGPAGKEILRRRGVISGAASRSLGALELDEVDLYDIGAALKVVEPYFRL